MLRRRVVLSATTFAVSLLSIFAGCSSSSTNPNAAAAASDAGSQAPADSGASIADASVVADSGGPACLGSIATFAPSAFVAATAHQGTCATADITAFIAACGDNQSATSCGTWQDANVAGVMSAAATGTACGNCIFPTANNGGAWVDESGEFVPNFGGCLQILDPAHGTACGTAFDNDFGCAQFACSSCTSDTINACQTAANAGSCNSYQTTSLTECAPELGTDGAGLACFPAGTSNLIDPDWSFIVNLICGSADGG
jgi:hypothetical protein